MVKWRIIHTESIASLNLISHQRHTANSLTEHKRKQQTSIKFKSITECDLSVWPAEKCKIEIYDITQHT